MCIKSVASFLFQVTLTFGQPGWDISFHWLWYWEFWETPPDSLGVSPIVLTQSGLSKHRVVKVCRSPRPTGILTLSQKGCIKACTRVLFLNKCKRKTVLWNKGIYMYLVLIRLIQISKSQETNIQCTCNLKHYCVYQCKVSYGRN